jgi:two-component system response regulator
VTKQPSVVLVEDDPSDVVLTLRVLTRFVEAADITVARDGVEALHLLKSATPRLVLLDLKLPRLDGLEVLQALKADERTRVIPVVMLTSSAEQADLEQAYRLGVNSYIVKPVDYNRFSEAVSSAGAYWLDINATPAA